MELALEQYISDVYKPSEDNIMELLIGDPGTGKNEWAKKFLMNNSDAAVLCNTKPNLLQQREKCKDIEHRFFQFEDVWDLENFNTIIIDEADIFYNSSYRQDSINQLLDFIERYKNEKKFIMMTGTFIEGLWFIPKSEYKLTRYTKSVERLLTVIKLVGVKNEDLETTEKETSAMNGNISMYAGTIARVIQKIWTDEGKPIILNNNNREQNEKIADTLRNAGLKVLCVSSKKQSAEYNTLVRKGFKHENKDGLDVDVVITTIFMSAGLSFRGIVTVTTPNTAEVIAQQHNRQRHVNGKFNNMYHIAGGDNTNELKIKEPVIRNQYDALMLGKTVFNNMVAAAYCDAYNDYSTASRLGYWSYGVLYRLIENYGFTLDNVRFEFTDKYKRKVTSAKKEIKKIIHDYPFSKYSDDVLADVSGVPGFIVTGIRKQYTDISNLFAKTPVKKNTDEIFWNSTTLGINVLRTIESSKHRKKFIEDVINHNTIMPESITKKSLDSASDVFWKNYVNFDVESLRKVYRFIYSMEKRNGQYKTRKEYPWYHVVGMSAQENNDYNNRIKTIKDKPAFHDLFKMNKRDIANLSKEEWKTKRNEYNNVQTKDVEQIFNA